jgi:hypothetical protein
VTYSYGRANLDGDDFDYRNQAIAASFVTPVTTNTSLRLGYGYRTFRPSGDGEETNSHDVNVGLDYARTLTLSRRTTFGFGAGSSIVATQHAIGEGDGDGERGGDTVYFVSGYASLNHELSRRWTAALSYTRGLDFNPGFADPLFTDAFSFGVYGAVGRRMDMSFNVAYAAGGVGVTPGSGGFDSYTGSVRSDFRLTRFAGLFAHYFYYNYAFDLAAALPPAFPRRFQRQGVRAGVRLSLPLLR